MIEKHLLCPERVRRVPSHFSWVDHRLVRDHHLPRADAKAWALYLVLVTVGDEHGLSYYSDASLGRLLSLHPDEVVVARGQLIAAALIARSLHVLRQRGMEVAALGVDAENPTGALQLYQRAGFRPKSRLTFYRKPFEVAEGP